MLSNLNRFVLPVLVLVVDARAAPATSVGDPRADQLFDEGNALMEKNDVAGAAARYRASFDLRPRAKVALNLGIALAELGRDTQAAEAFAAYVDDPAADLAKRKVIESTLDGLRARLGELKIFLEPAGPADELTVDGVRPLAAGRTFVGPGVHVVAARRAGFAAGTTSIEVAAGTTTAARLVLVELPRPAGMRPVWKWMAWGVAGAAAAVGATFGILALERWRDVERRCPGDVCPPGDAVGADEAHNAARISTAAFVVCGVAAAGGFALWLTEPHRGAERGARITIAPVERGGLVGIAGSY